MTHDPNEILSDVIQRFDPSKKDKVFSENDLNTLKKILLIQKMQDHIKNTITAKTTLKPRHSEAGKTAIFSKNDNDIIIDGGEVSFFSYIPLISLELLGFLMLIILILCALFCTCCPVCSKEGTIHFGRSQAHR